MWLQAVWQPEHAVAPEWGAVLQAVQRNAAATNLQVHCAQAVCCQRCFVKLLPSTPLLTVQAIEPALAGLHLSQGLQEQGLLARVQVSSMIWLTWQLIRSMSGAAGWQHRDDFRLECSFRASRAAQRASTVLTKPCSSAALCKSSNSTTAPALTQSCKAVCAGHIPGQAVQQRSL